MAESTNVAFNRLSYAVLRAKAIKGLRVSLKRDIDGLPNDDPIHQRSVKALQYLTGYFEAVDKELEEARRAYDVQVEKEYKAELKRKLKKK